MTSWYTYGKKEPICIFNKLKKTECSTKWDYRSPESFRHKELKTKYKLFSVDSLGDRQKDWKPKKVFFNDAGVEGGMDVVGRKTGSSIQMPLTYRTKALTHHCHPSEQVRIYCSLGKWGGKKKKKKQNKPLTSRRNGQLSWNQTSRMFYLKGRDRSTERALPLRPTKLHPLTYPPTPTLNH